MDYYIDNLDTEKTKVFNSIYNEMYKYLFK